MARRRLGRTDLEIAPLVLGGNVFGWTADKRTSFDLLDRFEASGLNCLDTADSYSTWALGNRGGESEEIIGEWMKARGHRSRMVVVTKVGSDMGGGKKGLAPDYIEQAVEASLKRLQSDYIDLYLSHWPDVSVPYQDTLGAYKRLIEKGKIRFCGASNLDAGQLQAALRVASQRKLPRYDVLQPEYNLYDRDSFEGPLRELCIREEIGVITYFSLAKGFLSGKYRSADDLGKSPRGGGVRAYLDGKGQKILKALDAVSARHSAKPAEVALAWIIAQPGVTAPIASATNPDQLHSLVRATQIELSKADIAELDQAGG